MRRIDGGVGSVVFGVGLGGAGVSWVGVLREGWGDLVNRVGAERICEGGERIYVGVGGERVGVGRIGAGVCWRMGFLVVVEWGTCRLRWGRSPLDVLEVVSSVR